MKAKLTSAERERLAALYRASRQAVYDLAKAQLDPDDKVYEAAQKAEDAAWSACFGALYEPLEVERPTKEARRG